MTLEHITDQEARGAALLTEQFKYKPDLVALLKSWLGQIQAAEDAIAAVLVQRQLATAQGVNLDVLGAIVGQPRGGRSDRLYRVWIAARVLVNRSSGLTGQIIAIATTLVGTGNRVRLVEQYPAAFTVYSDDAIDGPTGVEIAKLLKLATAAGVGMQFQWYRPDHSVFQFSDTSAPVFDSAQGFGAGELAAVSDGRDMTFVPESDPSFDTDGLIVML